MAERIIALVAGDSGTGKSFFVAQLTKALIYDTDIGGGLAYADPRIKANGSERVTVGSYLEVLDDLNLRQRRKGGFATIVTVAIDHISSLHQEATIRHNPKDERDFGRSSDIATREWRKIRHFARNQDFNLIVTAHMKAKWENEKAVGMIAEGPKNIEGDMSIALQLRRANVYPSMAWVQKWRRDPDDSRGQIPSTFPMTIEAFSKLAGPDMFAARQPIKLATEDECRQLASLLDVAKLPEGTVEKWLKKAGVDHFGEMAQADILKCTHYVEKLLADASKKGV